jgi:hypothetical protein
VRGRGLALRALKATSTAYSGDDSHEVDAELDCVGIVVVRDV